VRRTSKATVAVAVRRHSKIKVSETARLAPPGVALIAAVVARPVAVVLPAALAEQENKNEETVFRY
jgi:hypothetical protein